MYNDENKVGGTLGESEASKNDLPKWTGPNQENVESTNSDASNASADSQARVKVFLRKLDEQVQSSVSIERIDKQICRIINSWANKPTKEAKRFFKKGYSRYRYIGRKLGQAAVPFDTGLDYLKSKYPDEEPKHLEEEYTWGFGEIDYDPDFRNKLTKNLRP